MEENLAVYETLRNEIISIEEQQRNVWLHMYILYLSMFVVAVEWNYYLYLATYIILIPYQMIINRYKWSISKISLYIKVFFEEERNDIHWESLHAYKKYREYEENYNKGNNKFMWLIRYTGSLHLAAISTILFLTNFLGEINEYTSFIDNIDKIPWLVLTAILAIYIIWINSKFFARKNDNVETVFQSYKAEIIDKQKK